MKNNGISFAAFLGPHIVGRPLAVQAFCPRQNLGAGRIHSARAVQSLWGPWRNDFRRGQARRKCVLSVLSRCPPKHLWLSSSWTRSDGISFAACLTKEFQKRWRIVSHTILHLFLKPINRARDGEGPVPYTLTGGGGRMRPTVFRAALWSPVPILRRRGGKRSFPQLFFGYFLSRK